MTFTNAHGGVAVPKPGGGAKRGKQRAYKMEKRLEKDLNEVGQSAKRVVMSGALKGVGLDGDVEARDFLVEAKSYTPVESNGARYIRFDVEWLNKIMQEAKLHGKPGLVVLQPKGSQRKFVVADWDQFLQIVVRALPGGAAK